MLYPSIWFFALLAAGAAASEPARLPCVADTWIESPPWERIAANSPGAENHGGDLELAVNGRNNFALLQFDFSAARGKSVRKATLRVYRKPAPVPLVTALATGDQFGLMLSDEKGQTRTRHSFGSRESPNPPVLIVETEPPTGAAPGRVDAHIIDNTPQAAQALGRTSLRAGSVTLRFGAANAARYDLRYAVKAITSANFAGAAAVPRWMMDPLSPNPLPLARANSLSDKVTAIVEDLKPGAAYYFAARAIDKAGREGLVTPLGTHRAYDRTYPELPKATHSSPPVVPSQRLPVSIWAVPELLKIDPKTGNLLESAHF